MTTYFQKRTQGPEIQIEDAVASNIDDLFMDHQRPKWTAGSLKVGAGIPDLLSVTFLPDVLALADSENLDVSIMSYLRAIRCAYNETIAQRIRQSPMAVINRLEKLVSLGIVNLSASSYSLVPIWRNVLLEVICVEAKMTNWKVALTQAKRNLIFAHKSYVALPEKTAMRIRNENQFKKYGIGLLSIKQDNSLKVIRRARSTTPKVWFYYYQVAKHLAFDLKNRCNYAVCGSD